MVTQTTVRVDSLTTSTDQPADYVGLTAGSHAVKTTDLPGLTEKVAMCSYPDGGTECTINNSDYDYVDTSCPPGESCGGAVVPTCDGTWCSINASVAYNTVTKVSFKYVGNNATSTTLVRRVGPAGTTTSAPSGTQAKIGSSGTLTSSNPASYSGLNGSIDVYATDKTDYSESYGTCTYTSPSTNCTVSSYTTINTANCTGGYCKATVSVGGGVNTIVQFKYTADSGVTRTCSVAATPSVLQTNRPIVWSVATTPADNYSYSLTETVDGIDTAICASDASPSTACSSVTRTYVSSGSKKVTAKVFSPSNPLVQYATCSATLNTVKPSIIEI
jgi:hypothetical protein